ncbi:hypothetical protein VTN77DRAFT_2819 [Rasamsonia byssochlamydoides]|uniref:uncharacterized protein n=1 Tax=Rasamsonia byssochlamydoides TaxID=89139 RepID=UPI003741F611
MTQDLPAGLVTTTGKIRSELDGLGDVAVEDIAQLWRVYTTHSSVQRDGAGARLENLFWRIWGSTRLRETLTGSTLAALFMDISEDRPLRTTPRQSPQAALKKTSRVSPEPLNNLTLPTKAVSNYNDAENFPSAAHSVQTRTPLPSILKKPNAEKPSATPGEPSSFKTTRILVPESAIQKDKAMLAPTMGAPATVVAATSRDPAQKQGRKKPTFIANTPALSKRRPVLIKRKSAQTSPTAEVSEDSLLASEAATTKENAPVQKTVIQEEWDNGAQGLSWQSLSYLRSDDGNNNQTTSTSSAASRLSPPPIGFTASSVHRHRSPDRPSSTEEAADQQSSTSPSLVDRDFRTRFVERRRQEASSLTNPSSSYLRSLIAKSDIGQLRRGSRSLSPATRLSVMPPPSKSADPVHLQPSSSRRGRSPARSCERPAEDPNNNPSSTPNNTQQPQPQPQPNRANYASGLPSVQSASARGEFTLPKSPNSHLSSFVDRSRQRSRNRT